MFADTSHWVGQDDLNKLFSLSERYICTLAMPKLSTGELYLPGRYAFYHYHFEAKQDEIVEGDHMPESKEFIELLDQIRDLHKRKNDGYAGKDATDPWANFRMAERVGVSAFKGCLVRMTDKMVRVMNLSRDEENDQVGEPITDTLMDLSVYSLIAICLYNEQHPHANKQAEPIGKASDIHANDGDLEFTITPLKSFFEKIKQAMNAEGPDPWGEMKFLVERFEKQEDKAPYLTVVEAMGALLKCYEKYGDVRISTLDLRNPHDHKQHVIDGIDIGSTNPPSHQHSRRIEKDLYLRKAEDYEDLYSWGD